MKRWIAILLAICLMLSFGALAQAGDGSAEATDAAKLPAPEEVSEMEDAEEDAAIEPEQTDEAVDADDVEGVDDVEAVEAEAVEIPEAEPTPTPEPEEPETFEVWFEEGFALTLPEGWVSYAVSEEDRANGIRYALGDGTGERNLYIQFKPTRVADIETLSEAVENTEGLSKTGDLTFGETDFVAFIDSRQNASCCATLWGGDLAVFMFTPQTDSDFMLDASQLMESFNIL